MFKKIIFPLIALGLLVSTASFAAEHGTRDEAIALTNKAVEFYKANGKEAAIKEFNGPTGQFIDRDLYITLFNVEDGVRLAHIKESLRGKSIYDAKDIDGKAYGEEIMEIATKGGDGWVTYKFTNPTTGVVGEKESYILVNGDVAFLCGVYKN